MTPEQQAILDAVIRQVAEEECRHYDRSFSAQLRLWLEDPSTLQHVSLLIRTRYTLGLLPKAEPSFIDKLRRRLRKS